MSVRDFVRIQSLRIMYISLTKRKRHVIPCKYNKKYFAKPYLLLFTWQGIKGGVNNILPSNVQQHTHADKKGKAYSCLIILYCRLSVTIFVPYTLLPTIPSPCLI
jgi:hypothetical protein